MKLHPGSGDDLIGVACGGDEIRSPGEWVKQAEYDLDTAEYMLHGGRKIYAVFMCHLCLEKSLKALYQKVKSEIPPRTHNLAFLME